MKCFICLSGLDGSGKTTQCKLLYEYLLQKNPIYYTFGNIEDNKHVNRATISYLKKTNLVLNNNQKHLIKSAFHMYFDIKQLTHDTIYHDRIVIMDRYVETIYAHAQLYGLRPEIISGIFEDIYIRPDYYFFLDLDPKICYKRILQRGNAIGTHEELCNLIELYEFYKSIVKTLGVKLIDADKTLSEVHQSIVSHIKLDCTGKLR